MAETRVAGIIIGFIKGLSESLCLRSAQTVNPKRLEVLLVASLIVSTKKERVEHCCYVESLETGTKRINI
jgi:hypothetical protein